MKKDDKYRDPPRIAEWLLKKVYRNRGSNTRPGDFGEIYNDIRRERTFVTARFWYWYQVFVCVFLRMTNAVYWGIVMIRNYLKITLRTLKKYKEFSIINIIGFALSMSICLMIIIFIKDQKNSDRFHDNKDRIVRVYTTDSELEWDVSGYATTPGILAPYLSNNYPFIENTVRIKKLFDYARKGYNDIPVSGLFVEPSFFSIFSYRLKYGNPETALNEPYSIIISEETAIQLFGHDEPVNETILFNRIGNYTITGVFEETAQKSHFEFDVLASFSTVPQILSKGIFPEGHEINNSSTRFKYYTYVLLRNEDDVSALEEQLPQITKNIITESSRERYAFKLQNLLDINLGMILHESMPGTRHLLDLIFLPFIGIFLIGLSCSNYIILSIARSLKRTKEIGLRKVIGAKRKDIIALFLCESFAITLIALVASCFFLIWLIPAVNGINAIAENNLLINMDILSEPGLYIIFVLFTAVVSVLAGLYPALHLSLIRAVNALRGGTGTTGIRKLTSRKVLMSIQFAISLMSIIFIVYFYQVTEYWLSFDIGINTENIVSLRLQDVNHEVIKNELRTNSNIICISFSDNIPVYGGRDYRNLAAEKSENIINAFCSFIDTEFIDNFELKLVAGRNFSTDFSTDIGKTIIINENMSGLLDLGASDEAIGKRIILDKKTELTVIGIVKDFNFRSLENKIGPMAFLYYPEKFRYANIKYVQGKKEDVKVSISKMWDKTDRYNPVDYLFFEDIQKRMKSDIDEIIKFASVACGYIIFVALCGLLGMSMYTTELRVKEIGIRKAFGSSVSAAVYVLSKDYIKLILYSSAFAIPCAFFLTAFMMQFIATRPGLSLWVPPVTLIFVLTLALLTISSQTIKAAQTNPVNTLREE
ncbi:ABC transporter permease [candidate division KSB1 bacterium]